MTPLLLMLVASPVAAPVRDLPGDWVMVKGCVVWPEKEAIPERKDLAAPRMSDREYTLKGGPLLDDTLIVDEKTRGVKNVVVYLRPDSDDREAKFPADKIHPDLAKPKPRTHPLGMEFCRYSRRVLAVRGGDTLTVTNHGAVAENFRFQGDAVDQNVTLPPSAKPLVTDPIPAALRPHLFQCDIHPWMQGRVYAFDHPYFAVTNDRGEFEIRQVPKGKWRVVYRHDLGFHQGYDGRLGFPIEVADKGKGEMTLKDQAFEAPTKPR